MARTFPSTVVEGMYAQTTGVVILALLEVSHSNFSTVYLVNNVEDVTSNGQLYTAFPFSIVLPPDDDENQPFFQVTIDNVTREFIDEFRTVAGNREAIIANIKLIEFADPDTVLVEWSDFTLRNIQYTAQEITFQLQIESFLNEPFPGDTLNPSQFPGIF